MKFLRDRNPIGAQFSDWDQSTAGLYTIVGVVEDAQYWPPNDLQEAGHPMYFLPAWQWAQVPASTPKASLYQKFVAGHYYVGSLQVGNPRHGTGP